jgi:hypothetical protein
MSQGEDSADATFIEGHDVTPVNMMTLEGEITCMMDTDLVNLLEDDARKTGKTFEETVIARLRLGMALYEARRLSGDDESG